MYLVVSQKTIHERKDLATRAFIDNLINEWGGEIMLWIGLIQITEVHAQVNHALFLVNLNRISHTFLQL